jgi:ABC-type Fe3+-hydroxamate transport system substrate-binding protein
VAAGITGKITPAAKAAQKLLKDLNDQYTQLTKATKKDLIDTKAFAGVSSSIDKVSESTHVASDTAKQYAGMMGIAVDKNGVAAVSSKTLADRRLDRVEGLRQLPPAPAMTSSRR